mgnify:CR=1 FL=1
MIGGIDKSDTEKTSTAKRGDNIVESVNYITEGIYQEGYSRKDVVKVRVTITITVGTETLVKTYTFNATR